MANIVSQTFSEEAQSYRKLHNVDSDNVDQPIVGEQHIRRVPSAYVRFFRRTDPIGNLPLTCTLSLLLVIETRG